MNNALIVLATAISIVPGIAGAGPDPSTPWGSPAMDLHGHGDATIFTDVPGVGLVIPGRIDPSVGEALLAFDPVVQGASPGLDVSPVSIIYMPDRRIESGRAAPPVADTFSILLAGVGVMGLIAQRKSRLRLALAR